MRSDLDLSLEGCVGSDSLPSHVLAEIYGRGQMIEERVPLVREGRGKVQLEVYGGGRNLRRWCHWGNPCPFAWRFPRAVSLGWCITCMTRYACWHGVISHGLLPCVHALLAFVKKHMKSQHLPLTHGNFFSSAAQAWQTEQGKSVAQVRGEQAVWAKGVGCV